MHTHMTALMQKQSRAPLPSRIVCFDKGAPRAPVLSRLSRKEAPGAASQLPTGE